MRIEDSEIREYYLKESKSQGWSVRQLQRNINSHYYERLLSSLDKKSDLISLKESEQLLASKYRLVLPPEEELKAELEREIQLIEEQQRSDET